MLNLDNYEVKVWLSLFLVLVLGAADPATTNAQPYYDTGVKNPLVEQNRFLKQSPDFALPPPFESVRSRLPQPLWPARKDVIACYWKAWELAFKNVRPATKENGFIQPYISPAFNNHLFMWDCSFMVIFGNYGHGAFNFQGTMDNFYKNQHMDGYICREISEENGLEIFSKYDPSSTGPNLMGWAEWEYYQNFKDLNRLQAVFPVLLAYYEWLRENRTWQDGAYYSSGWGCGMDNQPRVPADFNREFSHAFMSFVDTNLQQVFAGNILVKMAEVLAREGDVKAVQTELATLRNYLQQNMWDKRSAFYYDRFRDGSLSKVKSIAGY